MSVIINDPCKKTVPLKIRKIAPRPELDPIDKAHEARKITAPDPQKDFVDIDLEEFASIDFSNAKITLEPSSFCNLRCRYCAVPKDNSYEIVWDRISYIFKLVKLGGISTAIITGGEPGFFKDIRKIITDMKSWGFYVSLLTNGTWASDMDRTKELISCGLTEVHISIKEFTRQSFLSLSQRDLFQRSKQGLMNLLRLQQDGYLKYCHMNHVITKYSSPVKKIIDFFTSLGSYPDFFLLTMVEPIKEKDYTLIPELNRLLSELDDLLSFFEERQIPYRLEGIPFCLLGNRYMQSLDRMHMGDRRYRIFVTAKEDGDYVFVFKGWTRFLQFTHGENCRVCAYIDECPGVHKTILEYWREDLLKPLAAREAP